MSINARKFRITGKLQYRERRFKKKTVRVKGSEKNLLWKLLKQLQEDKGK